MEKMSELAGMNVEMIEEITEIYEISNEFHQMFCFTITLNDQRVINIIRRYSGEERSIKEREIKQLHERIWQNYEECQN